MFTYVCLHARLRERAYMYLSSRMSVCSLCFVLSLFVVDFFLFHCSCLSAFVCPSAFLSVCLSVSHTYAQIRCQ